jgi:hypothetical protein
LKLKLGIALFHELCKLVIDYRVDDEIDIGYGKVIVHAERADASLFKSYAPEGTFESQASANPTWWYQLATALIKEEKSSGRREAYSLAYLDNNMTIEAVDSDVWAFWRTRVAAF